MAEDRATFCPVCRRMLPGVHGVGHAQGKAAPKKSAPLPPEVAALPEGVTTGAQLAAGFDKKAYQREYMRRKRAEDKAKP